MSDKLPSDSSMKQSSSSPALPVLRHLRPEFRAQLLVMKSPKRSNDSVMQKSITIPVLKEETKSNGHSNDGNGVYCLNGKQKDVEGTKEAENVTTGKCALIQTMHCYKDRP